VALAVIGIVGGVMTIGASALGPGLINSLGSAPLKFLLFVLVGMLGAFIFTVGMVGYVLVGSLSHQLAEHAYNSIGTILACFGVAVVAANVVTGIVFVASSASMMARDGSLTPGGLTLSVLALDGALLGVLYLRIVHPQVLSWKQMGLSPDRLSAFIAQGVGYGVVTIVGTGLLGLLLQALGVQQTQEAMFQGVLSAPPSQFVAVLLAAGVFAPVVEETFFRGYILTGLTARWGTAVAFVISALLFALAHTNLQAFVLLFYAGLVLAFARWRSGSLIPGMVAHCLNNAIALLTLYLALHV
jgi:membrane protease YdiL (CAAX protease family)